MPEHVLTLALDFDGSLVESHSKPLTWRPRAKDFVLAAAAAGIRLWIHSCRCAPAVALEKELPGDAEGFWRYGRVPEDVEYSWGLYEEMRAFLEDEGVWSLMTPWTSPGKPIADMMVDDLGESPDWIRLAGELGLSLIPTLNASGERLTGDGDDAQRAEPVRLGLDGPGTIITAAGVPAPVPAGFTDPVPGPDDQGGL